jgi:large subunit ribosomal protein L32e
MSNSLKEKSIIRSKRPVFRRSSAVHTLKVSRTGYRRPKGVHNKMKDNRKGHPTQIKTGFGFPKETRGFTVAGKKIVTVFSVEQLVSYKPQDVSVIVSASLGTRTKLDIFKEMIAKKYHSHNLYQFEKYVQSLVEKKTKQVQENKQKAQKKQQRLQQTLDAKKSKDAKDASKTVKDSSSTQTTASAQKDTSAQSQASASPQEHKKQEVAQAQKVLTKPTN